MWVSALINPYGIPAQVINAVLSGQAIAVVNDHLLDELTAVLARPKFRKWIDLDDAKAFVGALTATAEVHPDPPSTGSQRLRDPDDDYLATLGSQAQAIIVTGDVDLLGASLDPPAITHRQFLDMLAAASDDG